ncbi:MAG: hypothetical protein ACI97A_002018 [Planctomycetota bacterium]|jgi:hypothetical protein
MAFLRNKAKEYGQLCLLFLGFLTGIGLVVTCGGGGGGGQQLPVSASATISFATLNVDGAGALVTGRPNAQFVDPITMGMTPEVDVFPSLDVNVPPALLGITNVQDALNRLNIILSPALAKATDILTPFEEQVTAENLPAFLKNAAGEPFTFSRALRGLVRAGALSGPLKADDAFFLTCSEGTPDQTARDLTYVMRSFCRDDVDTSGVTPVELGLGVIEIFDRDTITANPDIALYDQNLAEMRTRIRIDGGHKVSTDLANTAAGAPRISIFDGLANNETIAVTIDGGDGEIIAMDGAGVDSIKATGDTGKINADGSVEVGTIGAVDGTGSAAMLATGNVNADMDIEAGTTNAATGSGSVALLGGAGDVGAEGNVFSGSTDASAPAADAMAALLATGNANANADVEAGTVNAATGSGTAAMVGATGDVGAEGSVYAGPTDASAGAADADAAMLATGNVNANANIEAGTANAATGSGTVAMVGATGDVGAEGNVFAGPSDASAGAADADAAMLATGNVNANADVEAGTANAATGSGTVALVGGISSVGAEGSVYAGSTDASNPVADPASALLGSGNVNANADVEAGTTAAVTGTGSVALLGATGDVGAEGNVFAGPSNASNPTADAAAALLSSGDVTANSSVAVGTTNAALATRSILLEGVAGNIGAINDIEAGTVNGNAGTGSVLMDGSTGNLLAEGIAEFGTDAANTPGTGKVMINVDSPDGNDPVGTGGSIIATGDITAAMLRGTMTLSTDGSIEAGTVGGVIGTGTILLDGPNSIANVGLTAGTGAPTATTIVLDGSATGASSFGSGATGTMINSTDATVNVGSGTADVNIDGVNSMVGIGDPAATGIVLDGSATGASSFGTGATGTMINSTDATVNVGSGTADVNIDGVNSMVGIGDPAATGIVLDGSATGASSFGTGATGTMINSTDATVNVGSGLADVNIDGVNSMVGIGDPAATGIVLDGSATGVSTFGTAANSTTINSTNATVAVGTGAADINLDGVNSMINVGDPAATGIVLDGSATGVSTFGTAANSTTINSTNATVAVGTGAADINLDGVNSTINVGDPAATGIVLDGSATGISTFGTAANSTTINSTNATMAVGTGTADVNLDGVNSTVMIGDPTVGGISFDGGATGISTFGVNTSATGIEIDSMMGTFSVGNGATTNIDLLSATSTAALGDQTADGISINGSTGIINVGFGTGAIVIDGGVGMGTITVPGTVTAGNFASTTAAVSTFVGDVNVGTGGVILSATPGATTGIITTGGVTFGSGTAFPFTVDASDGAVTASGSVTAAGDIVTTDGRMVVQAATVADEIATIGEDGATNSGLMTLFDSDGAGFLKTLVTAGRDVLSTATEDDGLVEVYSDGVATVRVSGSNGFASMVGKSFIQPHPENPKMMIKYICLEGPENGLYARGTGKLVDGFVQVTLPESFKLAASNDQLSIVLTPMGDCAGLYAPKAELTRDGFVVRELFNGRSSADFSWVVNGVRRGFETHDAIVPNTMFRPTVKDREYLPSLPGLQDVMIQSGLLNSDGTPNEQVAAESGMTLKTSDEIRRDRENARTEGK